MPACGGPPARWAHRSSGAKRLWHHYQPSLLPSRALVASLPPSLFTRLSQNLQSALKYRSLDHLPPLFLLTPRLQSPPRPLASCHPSSLPLHSCAFSTLPVHTASLFSALPPTSDLLPSFATLPFQRVNGSEKCYRALACTTSVGECVLEGRAEHRQAEAGRAELSCTSVQCTAERQQQQRSSGQGRAAPKPGWQGRDCSGSGGCTDGTTFAKPPESCPTASRGHSVGGQRSGRRMIGPQARGAAPAAVTAMQGRAWGSRGRSWHGKCIRHLWVMRQATAADGLPHARSGTSLHLHLALQAAVVALRQDGADCLVGRIVQVTAAGQGVKQRRSTLTCNIQVAA